MHSESRDSPRIAVALSGGGHRACLFALGALLYLVDAGRAGSLASVSSVSGGSLANGAIAQSVDLSSAEPAEVEAVVGRVAAAITGRGTLFGCWITIAYIAVVVLVGAAVLLSSFLAPLAGSLRVLLLLVGTALVIWMASLRGRVCATAFDRTLFRPNGRSTRLAEINDGLDHVICATDLHAGEHVYFSRRFVYSYRFGSGVPGDLRLSAAVQASAAFPGAFPAAWLPTARHRFAGGAQPEAAETRRMALVDGGVYDNMADQWAEGMESRRRRHGSDAQSFRDADELIVVNASAGLGWANLKRLRVPALGELLTLLRDKSVLYDNGNSLRRHALVGQFAQAERDGHGLRGALVHIPQSPFRVANSFARGDDPRAERARAAQRALVAEDGVERAEARWSEIAAANSAVPTTLTRFDAETAARLLRHAYVLAMVNLHVLLDHPLLEMPDPARFDQMAA